jgi:hypothetical protein
LEQEAILILVQTCFCNGATNNQMINRFPFLLHKAQSASPCMNVSNQQKSFTDQATDYYYWWPANMAAGPCKAQRGYTPSPSVAFG